MKILKVTPDVQSYLFRHVTVLDFVQCLCVREGVIANIRLYPINGFTTARFRRNHEGTREHD